MSSSEEVERIQSALKSEREENRRRVGQLGSDLREERGLKTQLENSLHRAEARLSATEDRRRVLEAEKAAAQKALLDKISAEKSMLTQINSMEKEFQKMLVTRMGHSSGGGGGGGESCLFDPNEYPPRNKKNSIASLNDHLGRKLSSAGSMTADELSKVKGDVNEDLKRMFQIGTEEKKRRKKVG